MTPKLENRQKLQEHEQARILPLLLIFLFSFFCVLLSHASLLHLPYFWDEGGYYVPAALDFYHSGTLIPVFTNAHPPLPNVLLGSLWHLFGFHILVTRITACFFAAAALTAVYWLGSRFLGILEGLLLAVLTAAYPIWFAQSSLAHADIFAAAFSLLALALYLTSPHLRLSPPERQDLRRPAAYSLLFCLSVLSKETAIVQPMALLLYEAAQLLRDPSLPRRSLHRRPQLIALALPFPVLCAWFGYHYAKTGQVFGNPVYLRYNATDNFTLAHIAYALRIRFVHLFWQREIWVPLALAAACFLLQPRLRHRATLLGLPSGVTLAILMLVGANWLAFSVLGGALLTRYLLPVYPLLLLVCVAVWKDRLEFWFLPGLLALIAFVPAIWLNPSTFFAPEDNLTYRNMIVVQQQAIDYLNQHAPGATVLTAWPVSADLFRPELGYTKRRFRVFSIENFTRPELDKAAAQPGEYDTALVFATHYTSPAFRQFLLSHPTSWRGRRYAADLDLSPGQIAQILGGEVVWQNNLYGEWAAVLRFPRTYNTRQVGPAPYNVAAALAGSRSLHKSHASSPGP